MERILTDKELLNHGFQKQEDGFLDNGGYYEWWEYIIGETQIAVTNEFEDNEVFKKSYVEIDNESYPFMKGSDVIQLIKILRNGKVE